MIRKRRTPRIQLECLEGREVPALFTTASAPNEPARVEVKDTTTWATLFTLTPFGGFRGGIQTALADANSDGIKDIFVAAGPGGSAALEIYNGATGTLLRTQTTPATSNPAGTSIAAAGSVANADDQDLIAYSLVEGGTSKIVILNAVTGAVVSQFQPFGSFSGPLSIAAADVNADGTADLIVGAGPGGGPRLAVIDGANGNRLFDQFMFESFFTGGINVSTGDVDGDARTDIVVGAGIKGGPRVRVLNTETWTTTRDFFAFDPNQRNGVQASVFTSSLNGPRAIYCYDGLGENTSVKALDATTLTPVASTELTGLPTTVIGTITGPTYVPPTSPPPPVSPPPPPPAPVVDSEGMVSTLPDVNASNWQVQENGLKIWDVQTGSGPVVTTGADLAVYYTGWLLNGTSFDSRRTPATPAEFNLNQLIEGWKQGLPGMKAGGIRRLYIPSALAYGPGGTSGIPGNSDLVFEIKVKSVNGSVDNV